MSDAIQVEAATVAAVTDLGRPRGPSQGIALGGALDQYSARVANILVANEEEAPLIEVTAYDFAFTAHADLLLAVTGAPMTLTVDDVERRMWEPLSVSAGQRVAIADMADGLRTYIAVHGSFKVPRLLGSCAPDAMIGFGTTLTPGTRVGVNRPVAPIVNPFFDMALFNLDVLVPFLGDDATIDVTDGPDSGQFGSTGPRLFEGPYTVTDKSNHVGLRLAGNLPVRVTTGEVLSRGVPVGAVEVPPGDEVLILHRGRGVTAGYPVLAVVTPLALDALGQVRPGQRIRFRHVEVERTTENIRAWRARLDHLRHRVDTVFSCLGVFTPAHPTPRPSGREVAEKPNNVAAAPPAYS